MLLTVMMMMMMIDRIVLAVVIATVVVGCSYFHEVSAVKDVPQTLFGGWYFLDNFGPFNGTLPPFIPDNTNYILLSFINPATMIFPQNFIEAIESFPNHFIMASIGGASLAGNWNWLNSEDSALAAAQQAAKWASFGIDGIDIDAEAQATNYPPENMVSFLQELKKQAPQLKVSLCVNGNPEGTTFYDYLINNHLNGAGPRYIDWIHVMAYAGYSQDVAYIEHYTKAPNSKWDHPINQGVSNSSVIIGMKGTKGFPSCDPDDYTEMIQYVKNVGLGGVAIWAFTNSNSNGTLPWFDPTCNAGYGNLCKGLLNLSTCGNNINPGLRIH
eukprot:m.44141 g.44141  ORF g.44141 m.44141 type:complete len:327 (+) comp7149_c0_seq1:101-1081(+)